MYNDNLDVSSRSNGFQVSPFCLFACRVAEACNPLPRKDDDAEAHAAEMLLVSLDVRSDRRQGKEEKETDAR